MKIYYVEICFDGKKVGYKEWKEFLICAVVFATSEDEALQKAIPEHCEKENPISKDIQCIGKANSAESEGIVLRNYRLLK